MKATTKSTPSRKRVPRKRTPRKRKPRRPADAPRYPRSSLFYVPTLEEVAEIVRRGDQFKQQARDETARRAALGPLKRLRSVSARRPRDAETARLQQGDDKSSTSDHRAARRPAAADIHMLDGYVTAIVAGPVSLDPPDWICPLLGIDVDAFNRGGTPEFAAISAVAMRHNEISNTLSTTPDQFRPMHRRKRNGDVDARPWCRGFYAAMQLQMPAWGPLLDLSDVNHGLLLPILLHCVDSRGRPLLGPTRPGRKGEEFLRNAHTDIPAVVEAMRQYWMPTRYRR